MSRDFTKNVSNWMSLGANAFSVMGGASGVSFCAWVFVDTQGTFDDLCIFFNAVAEANVGILHRIGTDSSAKSITYAGRVAADAYGKSYAPIYSFPTAQWVHCGVTVDWSADPYVFRHYINGTQNGTGTSSGTGGTYTHTTSTGIDAIGCATALGVPIATFVQIDGRIAEFAVWGKVITSGDFLSLGSGARPSRVQPASLKLYLPLNGQGSPEVELFNRLVGTINGTIAVAEHPRVF